MFFAGGCRTGRTQSHMVASACISTLRTCEVDSLISCNEDKIIELNANIVRETSVSVSTTHFIPTFKVDGREREVFLQK